jgi:hypothetical protein
VNLHSFLALARDHDDHATILPHAEGFRPALAGTLLVPHYASNEDWEADFGQACRPWRDGDEPLTQPYAIATRQSIDEFLAAHPEIVMPPPAKDRA